MKSILLLTFLYAVLGQSEAACAGLCPSVAARAVTQFKYKTKVSDLPRVEIRMCDPGGSETLQLAAWGKNRNEPFIVLDTTDFTIVQIVARGPFYMIETGGGSRDQVFVVLYEKEVPVLKLRQVTKGSAHVTLGPLEVLIEIDGIYAGDREGRSEVHRFSLE